MNSQYLEGGEDDTLYGWCSGYCLEYIPQLIDSLLFDDIIPTAKIIRQKLSWDDNEY